MTHTHALFADQSHSIPDNLVALLGYSRAWNCSDRQRLICGTFAKINALLAMSVTRGNSVNIRSLAILPPLTPSAHFVGSPSAITTDVPEQQQRAGWSDHVDELVQILLRISDLKRAIACSFRR
jgi:hypothetical protein